MQPNRLERLWPFVVTQLQRSYPAVPAALWEGTGGQHDRIVRLIRDTYAVGRSELTVEAEVRDLLNRWCDEAEQA